MFYHSGENGFLIQDIFRVTRKKGTLYYSGRDFSGLAFRYSGSSVFKYTDKSVSAQTGSITYIPAGLDFEIESEAEEVIILHLHCYDEKTSDIITIPTKKPDVFSDLFFSMYEIWQQRKPGYQNKCTAMLYSLFEKMEQVEHASENPKGILIQPGVLYMNMHYTNPTLTLSDTAKKCNISDVYFRKIFKEIYGISPAKALIHMRIDHAIRLLESGYYRVSEVSQMSGFADVKYFSTAFKKETGKTPSDYVNA